LLHLRSLSLLISARLLILSALVQRPDPRLHLCDRPHEGGQLTSDEGYVLLGCHCRPEVYGRLGKGQPSRPAACVLSSRGPTRDDELADLLAAGVEDGPAREVRQVDIKLP
jgi:hypothetical protein